MAFKRVIIWRVGPLFWLLGVFEMILPEVTMQLISKFSFTLCFISGVLALFSYLKFSWLLGSLSNAFSASHELIDLRLAYPLRAVAGRPRTDRAMRLLRDFAKSKSDMGLPENLVSILVNTNKWHKITILFAIQFIIAFIIGGIANT